MRIVSQRAITVMQDSESSVPKCLSEHQLTCRPSEAVRNQTEAIPLGSDCIPLVGRSIVPSIFSTSMYVRVSVEQKIWVELPRKLFDMFKKS